MDPVNVPAKFAVRIFTRSRDNSDWSFGVELRTPNHGEEKALDEMAPFERALMTSYRLAIVTLPLSLRVSEILLLLCSSTPLFPTPPLVSPKFPHVPIGVGGWPLGSEERRCWANCSCDYSFHDFQPMWSWSNNVTDRRTERRTICSRNTALCTIVHRAVKHSYEQIHTSLFLHCFITFTYMCSFHCVWFLQWLCAARIFWSQKAAGTLYTVTMYSNNYQVLRWPDRH